ncbi:MAG: helix-turn-helix domain-containing protein [Planctomycetota bacterium]
MSNDQFNGHLLCLARESRGRSQTWLASNAGVSQPFISQLEEGSKSPSSEVLQRLSRALDYPVEFFCRQWERTGLGVGELHYRRRRSAGKTALRQIEAAVNLRLLELSNLLRFFNAADDGPMFFPIDTDRSGGVEGAADRLRALWNVPAGPIASVTRLLERHGAIVMLMDFGTDKVDALGVWTGDLPPVFFVSHTSPADRRRMSLAHEVAHVVLHMRSGRMPDDLEAEANHFAGAFLMPASDFRTQLKRSGKLTVDCAFRLKSHWNTSAASIIFRAGELGCVTTSQQQRLWRSFSARGFRKEEPQVFAPERPLLLPQLLKELSERNPDRISDVFPLPASDFGRVYRTQQAGLRLT